MLNLNLIMKNLKSFFIIVLLFLIAINANAQKNIKDLLKYTLNEKMYFKLGEIHDQDKINLKDHSALRDILEGEKLLADSETGTECEVSAAINPKDSNNMVVSAIHFAYNPDTESPLSISTYYTRDFGATWQKSTFDGIIEPDNLIIGGGDPVLVYDKEGNLHLTYILLELISFITFDATASIYHAVSKDGGQTWTPGLYFKSQKFDVFTFEGIDHFLDKQWMAADNSESTYKGNVYLSYVDFAVVNLEEGKGNIKVGTYHPNDSTFIYDPVTISSDSFYFAQFSSIDVDNEGNVFVGFVGSYDSLEYYVFNSVSKDGGKTFSEPTIVSKVYIPGFTGDSEDVDLIGVSNDRYYPCPYLAIDKSKNKYSGRIYYSWTCPGIDSLNSGSYDIFLSYSDDKGITWSTPTTVNNDKLKNSDQFYSTIDVNENGTPILCFYDKRDDAENNNRTAYYLAYNTNEDVFEFDVQFPLSKQVSDFSKIGKENENFGIGEYNKTVTTGSYAIPFWADGRKNSGDINIYMSLIPLDGKSHSTATEFTKMINGDIVISSLNPNPAKNHLIAEFELKNTSDIVCQITDLSGNSLFKRDLGKQQAGNHHISINIENIHSGTFMISLISENGFVTKKFVVVK
jgi:hypothetical protein